MELLTAFHYYCSAGLDVGFWQAVPQSSQVSYHGSMQRPWECQEQATQSGQLKGTFFIRQAGSAGDWCGIDINRPPREQTQAQCCNTVASSQTKNTTSLVSFYSKESDKMTFDILSCRLGGGTYPQRKSVKSCHPHPQSSRLRGEERRGTSSLPLGLQHKQTAHRTWALSPFSRDTAAAQWNTLSQPLSARPAQQR